MNYVTQKINTSFPRKLLLFFGISFLSLFAALIFSNNTVHAEGATITVKSDTIVHVDSVNLNTSNFGDTEGMAEFLTNKKLVGDYTLAEGKQGTFVKVINTSQEKWQCAIKSNDGELDTPRVMVKITAETNEKKNFIAEFFVYNIDTAERWKNNVDGYGGFPYCNSKARKLSLIDNQVTVNNGAALGTLETYGGAASDGTEEKQKEFEDSLDTDSCDSQGGALSWMLCPVLKLVGGSLNWIDTQLSRLLEIDENKYDTSQMYEAWSKFRNIGLSLLIIAMLVMVISTALGFSFLDAYTVKKAFPRMVAAIIFMLLSWYACLFLIKLSNVIGQGTIGIMTAPFDGAADSLTSLFKPSAGAAAVQLGGLALGAAAFTIVGAPGILLSWFATGLLIMGIAFLVLIARQMFILVLVLLSPIAILSWIFPGNDKVWKFWWQTFSKLLIMYPLIMALIASGRIFAGVIANVPAGGLEGGLLNPLLKFTAYVIPYAFIPFTFKAAGGIFGNLVGMANDRSRGAFDRLKKGRQKGMAEIGRNMKAGVGFRGETGNMRNRFSSGVASGPRGWVSSKRRAAFRESNMALAGAAQAKENPIHEANKNNDMYLLAAASESLARKKIADAEAAKAAAVASGDTATAASKSQEIEARKRALAMAQSIPNKTAAFRRQAAMELAATGYQLSSGAAGHRELSQISREINGTDDAAHANFMNGAQYNLKNAGRFDLAGLNNGGAYDAASGVGKASLYELANAKKESIQAMVRPGMTSHEKAVAYAEMQSMRPNSKGAVATEIDKQMAALEAAGVKTYNETDTGATYVDAAGVTRPVTVSYREDYDASKAGDPMYAAAWADPDDRSRGWKTSVRNQKGIDVALAEARTYVPPDPNKIT